MKLGGMKSKSGLAVRRIDGGCSMDSVVLLSP